jgi:hypothetical protein
MDLVAPRKRRLKPARNKECKSLTKNKGLVIHADHESCLDDPQNAALTEEWRQGLYENPHGRILNRFKTIKRTEQPGPQRPGYRREALLFGVWG